MPPAWTYGDRGKRVYCFWLPRIETPAEYVVGIDSTITTENSLCEVFFIHQDDFSSLGLKIISEESANFNSIKRSIERIVEQIAKSVDQSQLSF